MIFIKKQADEPEDYLFFVSVVALGSAAKENLPYGIRFMDYSIFVLISLFYLGTLGTALLHASATALAGYGLSLKLLERKSIIYTILFLALAIMVHSLFNLFAYSSQISNQIIWGL